MARSAVRQCGLQEGRPLGHWRLERLWALGGMWPRLRALARHMGADAAEQVRCSASGTNTDGYTVARGQGGPVGYPLARQDGSGQLTAESVAQLTDQMDAAARCGDFRTAANLQTMLKVLGPKSAPVPLANFTSSDADTAADILLEHGFCVLPNLISRDDLERMRAAYQKISEAGFPEERAWEEGSERKDLGKYFSFDMFSEERGDPAFYALADPPLLMNVVHRVLGRRVPFQGSGGRVLPVADHEEHAHTGYISWHRCAHAPRCLHHFAVRLSYPFVRVSSCCCA